MLRVLNFKFVLLLVLSSLVYGQKSDPQPVLKTQVVSGRLEVDLGRLWDAYLKAKRNGDLPGQEYQIAKIKSLARAPIFEDAAMLFLVEGQADLKKGNWESARAAFLNAAALNPYLWPAYTGLAEIKRDKEGQWFAYFNLSLKGFSKAFSWNNSYFMFAAWSWFMRYLIWVFMIAFTLVIGLLCMKYLRVFYATHCNNWEENGLQHSAARLLTLVLLSSPWILGLNPYLAAGAYLCLFFPFLDAEERKLGMVCLFSMVLLPLFGMGNRYSERVQTSPVVRGMLHQYVNTDLYSQEDFLRSLPVEGAILDRFKVQISKLQVARGETTEALATLAEIQENSEYWGIAQLNLGNLYLKMREYHRALEFYQKVVEKQPDSANAHYHLWIVKSKLANNAEAETHRQKAIELDPKLREQIALFDGAENATVLDADIPAISKVFSESFEQGMGWRGLLLAEFWAPVGVMMFFCGCCWLHLRQRNPTRIAKDCKKCGMIYLPDDAPNSDWCSQCVSIYIKREDLPAESKQKKADEIKRFNTKRKLVMGVFQLIFPGFKGLVNGKAFSSGLKLMGWVLLCVGIFYSVDQIHYAFMTYIKTPSIITYCMMSLTLLYWLVFGVRPLFQED